MDFQKEMLKGYIDTIIMSVLSERDMYGYEISKRITEVSEGIFEIKEATMYVSLKRLEGKGCLDGYWNDEERTGGGRRRYYRITSEGRKYLDERTAEWFELKKVIDKFMEAKL